METPEQTNAQVQNSLDSSGSDQPTPQGQPQAAPVAAAQTAPVAAPAASASTPSVAATSKNPQLHRLISGILGGIAGPPPATYSTDASGKLTANTAPPENNADRVKRIAQHALIGLSAASQVPDQKSGLGNVLAGFGAGANATQKQMTAQDAASKEDARKSFEDQQQSTLHKMELAKGNALLYSTYKHLHDEDIDKNEEYKVNTDIAKAFEAEKFPVRRIGGDQLFKEFHETPQQLITEGRVLLTGERAMTTPDGQAIVDPQTQEPRYERTYAVVDGLHEGKIKAPQSFVDYVNKYVPYADTKVKGYESLAEDQDIDAKTFYRLHNSALEGMKKVTDGWARPDALETKDGVFQKNLVTGEMKPATQEQTDAYLDKKAKRAETESITKKNLSEAGKADADAAKAKKDAAAGSVSNLTGVAYLQTLPTGRQATVHAVHEGRMLLPANRKEALAILEDVNQSFPDDFDEAKSKTWQKANNEYRGSGKTATQIVPSYNTALEHMQDLYNNTTGEGIFNPLSKAYQDREIALGYVAREVGKAVSAGAMTQKESEDLLGTLKGGLTPALKRERITKTAQLLHDKIDEYQTKFNEAAPSSAVKVPTLISPRAAQSYDYVQSGGKVQQNPPTSKPPQVFNPKTWAAANPGKDVNAAIAAAHAQGIPVKQ